jgi:hypothetical protein
MTLFSWCPDCGARNDQAHYSGCGAKAIAPDNGWRPIETAPKDGTTILVYGLPQSIEGVSYHRPAAYTAAWDTIDDAFCLSGGTWVGPFIDPAYWMPVPPPPTPPSVASSVPSTNQEP